MKEMEMGYHIIGRHGDELKAPLSVYVCIHCVAVGKNGGAAACYTGSTTIILLDRRRVSVIYASMNIRLTAEKTSLASLLV